MKRNRMVARVLEQMAELLEMAGEESFRAASYRRAARAVANLEDDIALRAAAGDLTRIPGIGEKLADKITAILATGTFPAYQRQLSRLAPGVVELLALPGLGPKTVRLLSEQLGITSVAALEAALAGRPPLIMPGLGPKTIARLQRGLELRRARERAWLLGEALPLAEEISRWLQQLPAVVRIALAGSVRRGKNLVGDIDLMVELAPGRELELLAHLQRLPLVETAVYDPSGAIRATVEGVPLEVVILSAEQYLPAVFTATGSKAHQQQLAERARERGLPWPPPAAGGETIDDYEARAYRLLGLEYIPPELREDRGRLLTEPPAGLIALEQIRGDLHVHSDWSDGLEPLAEMAAAARERGYAYLAVTDHSRALAISRGLDRERLLRQWREIDELNRNQQEFRILRGIEVDIRADGSLDLDDDLLAVADLVVAAVHSGFQQERDRMTARIVAALRHPAVDILAHPTGRLLLRREPYAVDLEAVFAAALAGNKALEVNACPERLDLGEEPLRAFCARGGLVAINTDAHDRQSLADIRYGVLTARRSGVAADRVVNTWKLEQLNAWRNSRRR